MIHTKKSNLNNTEDNNMYENNSNKLIGVKNNNFQSTSFNNEKANYSNAPFMNINSSQVANTTDVNNENPKNLKTSKLSKRSCQISHYKAEEDLMDTLDNNNQFEKEFVNDKALKKPLSNKKNNMDLNDEHQEIDYLLEELINNNYDEQNIYKNGVVQISSSMKKLKGDSTPKYIDTNRLGIFFNLENDDLKIEEFNQINKIKSSKINKNKVISKNKIGIGVDSLKEKSNISHNSKQITNINNITNSNYTTQKSVFESEFEEKFLNKFNKSTLTNKYEGKNFEKYDVQNMTYELVKEYNSLFKTDASQDFMKRMFIDVFKRQTKEKRVENLLEQNQVKIDEEQRIETFNRLIVDANRRLEAQWKIDEMKKKLDDGKTIFTKKYNQMEWEAIYEQRFKKFFEDKINAINIALSTKKIIEDELLARYIEETKPKKVSTQQIESSVNRMYADAERRNLKMQENIKKKELNENKFVKGKIKEEENQREESASKYVVKSKKNKKDKYNFQSDNEYESDNEKNKKFKSKPKYTGLSKDKKIISNYDRFKKEEAIEKPKVFGKNYGDAKKSQSKEYKSIPKVNKTQTPYLDDKNVYDRNYDSKNEFGVKIKAKTSNEKNLKERAKINTIKENKKIIKRKIFFPS